jgi:hypothetical protein
MQPLYIDSNFFFNWTWYNFFVLQFVFVLFPLSAPLFRFRFSLFTILVGLGFCSASYSAGFGTICMCARLFTRFLTQIKFLCVGSIW